MANFPELTTRQAQVLDFIQEKIDTWGYPPTIREIGEHLSIRSTNGVADHLKALKRKGYLTHQDMKSRTLKPVPEAVSSHLESMAPPLLGSEGDAQDGTMPVLIPATSQSVSIPLLGRVAAGEPILAEENAEGSVVIDSVLVGNGKRLFALKVVGESMIGDGIFDGDFIFVNKRSHADSGEIVVVLIDGEATVKRFYPEGDRIRLQPANDAMQPIYVNRSDFRDTQIIGVVVGVYRKMP